MSDAAALLAAIRAAPDDDAPRLIYADWLDEHGEQDRAEFIRVQVEAARLKWNYPKWNQVGGRAQQLLEIHGQEWIEPFRWLSPGGATEIYLDKLTIDGWGGGVQLSWVDPAPSSYGDVAPPYERAIEFHRGFIRKVFVEPEALARVCDAKTIDGPEIEASIKWESPITGDPNWAVQLWPAFRAGLRRLPFSTYTFTNYNYELGWVRPLVADPEIAQNVVGLMIDGGQGVAESDLIALYALVPRLEYLQLHYWQFSLNLIRELGRAGAHLRLQHFDFSQNHSVPIAARDVFAAMIELGTWPQLRSLIFYGLDGAGPDIIRQFGDGMFPSLRKIRFWGPGGTPEFFEELLTSQSLRHVGLIEYWGYGPQQDRHPAIRELADRSNGRFIYR